MDSTLVLISAKGSIGKADAAEAMKIAGWPLGSVGITQILRDGENKAVVTNADLIILKAHAEYRGTFSVTVLL